MYLILEDIDSCVTYLSVEDVSDFELQNHVRQVQKNICKYIHTSFKKQLQTLDSVDLTMHREKLTIYVILFSVQLSRAFAIVFLNEVHVYFVNL